MPPSPIGWSSLYGPITVPGCSESAELSAEVELTARFRKVDETVGGLVGLEKDHHAAAQLRVSAARLVEIAPAFGREHSSRRRAGR